MILGFGSGVSLLVLIFEHLLKKLGLWGMLLVELGEDLENVQKNHNRLYLKSSKKYSEKI